MSTLLDAAAGIAAICLGLAMLPAAWRVIRGPAAQDRVLGLDSLYMTGMQLLLVIGIRTASGTYFEVALLIALFGFVGSVALAKFLLRGEVIEP
jgi:multicomponent K+:H+ antiporter subunit F